MANGSCPILINHQMSKTVSTRVRKRGGVHQRNIDLRPLLFHFQIITVLSTLLKLRHSREGGNLSQSQVARHKLDSRLRGNDGVITMIEKWN